MPHEELSAGDSKAELSPIEILWEESTALVVNKPAGLLTQGAAGIETVETRLRNFLKDRDHHQGQPYVGLPHRIDRPVSGTLLVARNLRAVQRFGAQFQSRKIEKVYWAMTAGAFDGDSGSNISGGQSQNLTEHVTAVDGLVTWTDYMRKIPDRPVAEIVDEGTPGAKLAILHFRVLKRLETAEGEARTLLEVRLETGRMHQIRLQFASRGFPLLGDSMYGSDIWFGPRVEDLRGKAIALHARQIRFRHPKTGVETMVTAPLPCWDREEGSPHGWELLAGL